MKLNLKKVLKKAEKIVKKVAPVAITAVNPVLGAGVKSAMKTVQAVKGAIKSASDPNQQPVQAVAASGYTGVDEYLDGLIPREVVAGPGAGALVSAPVSSGRGLVNSLGKNKGLLILVGGLVSLAGLVLLIRRK